MENITTSVSPTVLKKSAVPTAVWGSSDSFSPVDYTSATTTTSLLHSQKYLAAINATSVITSDESSKTTTWNPSCISLQENGGVRSPSSDWANTGLFTQVTGNMGSSSLTSPLPFRVTTVINPSDASITLSLRATKSDEDNDGSAGVGVESLLSHHTWCFDTKHREDIKKASEDLLNYSKPSPSPSNDNNQQSNSSAVGVGVVSADPYAGDEEEYEEYDAKGNMVVVKKPAGGGGSSSKVGGVLGGGGIGLDDGVFIMAKHKAAISRVFPVKSEIVLTVIKDATSSSEGADTPQLPHATITDASTDITATEDQLASPAGKLLSNPAAQVFKSSPGELGLLEACYTRNIVVINGTQISQMRSGALLIIPFTIHCTTTNSGSIDKCITIRPSGACQWLRAGQEKLMSAPLSTPQPSSSTSPTAKKDHIHDFSIIVCDNGCVVSQQQPHDGTTSPKADLVVTQCFQLLTLSQRNMGLCMWELKGSHSTNIGSGEGTIGSVWGSNNDDVYQLRLLSKADNIRSLPNSNYNTTPSQERTGSLSIVSETPSSLPTRIFEVDSLTVAQHVETTVAPIAAPTTKPKGRNRGKQQQAKQQAATTTKTTTLAHRQTIQLAAMSFGSNASGSVTFVGATSTTKTPVSLHRLVKEGVVAEEETTTTPSPVTTIVFEPLAASSDVYKGIPEASVVGTSIQSPQPKSVEESLDTVCRFPGSRPVFVAVVHKRGTVELVSVLERNASHKNAQKVEPNLPEASATVSTTSSPPSRRLVYGLTCVKEVLLGNQVISVTRALPDELPIEYKQYILDKEAKEAKNNTIKPASTSTTTTTFRNLVVTLSPDTKENSNGATTFFTKDGESIGGGGLGGGDFWSQLRQDIQSTSTERQPINEVFSSDITRGNQKKQQQQPNDEGSTDKSLSTKSPTNNTHSAPTSLPPSIQSLLVSPSANTSSSSPAVISSTTIQDTTTNKHQIGSGAEVLEGIVVSFQEKPLWEDVNNPKYEVSTYRLNNNKNANSQRKYQKDAVVVDAALKNPLSTFMEAMSDEKATASTLHAKECSLLGSLSLSQQQQQQNGTPTLCWNWTLESTEQQTSAASATPFMPVEVPLKDVFPVDKCASVIILDVSTITKPLSRDDGGGGLVVVAITLGCLSNELKNSKLFNRMVRGINEANSSSFQTFTLVSEVATIEVPVVGISVSRATNTKIATPPPAEPPVEVVEPEEEVQEPTEQEPTTTTEQVEATDVEDTQVVVEPPTPHESTIDELTKTSSDEEGEVVVSPKTGEDEDIPVELPTKKVDEVQNEEGGDCGITLLEMEQLIRESCRQHREEVLMRLDIQFAQMERRIVSRVTSHLW